MNPTHRRTRAGVTGLLGLNAALLGVMAFVTFAAPVIAQFRPRGSYHAAVGSAPGASAGVIYVVDEVNQQLIAFTWDPNTKKLVGVGGTDLALDASRVGGRN
jgi:hypothetical protein